MEEKRGQLARRALGTLFALLSALAVSLLLGFYGLIVAAMGTCGGDGGSPYAARDSPQAEVCAYLEEGHVLPALISLLAGLVVLVGVVAGVR